MKIDLGDDHEPEIGLVALIDCIFFLLMFFMVATTFKANQDNKRDRSIPVDLPKAAATFRADEASTTGMVIAVARDGAIYVDGVATTQNQLHDRLRDLAARDAHAVIRIDGDRHAPFEDVVSIMDLCAFEGLTNLAVHVRN
ncbi:biopolymer transport protein ExbD [Luteibacter sp. UNC138MFCol5.1]|uniref:ExbD/TolR family protein n=1 Tax=Luteibacter sp. UNC138MFCol5.1 TaxID=1502774 RepID=UPI0008B5D7A5|nr:biopolymer transporter ExbD [Luteibacter sp. UNC138MFCol5.1]SEO31376.1 biopolymer transport protein ExbD [Luteibacter sp. UNC138MFCol5.1]